MRMRTFNVPTMTEAMELVRFEMGADTCRLSLSDVSITPSVADGITQINPASLARLLMPYTDTISAGDSHGTDHSNMSEAAL